MTKPTKTAGTSNRDGALSRYLRSLVSGAIIRLRIEGSPVPASRPRVSRFGGVYYARRYSEYYAEAQKQLAPRAKDCAAIADKPLAVAIECAVERPKTTKLTVPRGDVDNLAKGPLDAATKAGVWRDDTQIKALVVTKRWALPGEPPGVTMSIGVIKND